MKNGTRIFLITLIVLLLLGYVVAFAYCTYNKYAYADYEDVISDTNSIVNFNQLVFNDRITQTYTGNTSVLTDSKNYNAHKFYVRFKPDSAPTGSVFYLEGSGYQSILFSFSGSTAIERIIDVSFNIEAPFKLWANAQFNYSDMNIFDLTQMFGSGNEPTLLECQTLFVADNYTYTTGTLMTLSGVDSYNKALNDIFDNYKYMLDRNALSTQTQATNLMGTLSGTTNFGYNDENWYILGAMYCPLFTKISAASEFNIEIQLYAPSGRDNRYLCFGTYIDNELNEIYKIGHNGDGSTLNINFTTPIDVQTLYVYQRNGTTNEIEEMNYIVGVFNIRVEQLDIAGAIMSSYSSGYNTARDYYSEGGQGFADIFARGKASGLIEANGTFTAMDYVKTAFITLGEILMIEVFPNFTLGAFFLLPLLTSTIFFIVKLTRGGS